MLYELEGRGAYLSSVILDEVMRAEITGLALPLPRTHRLREVCRQLIESPALSGGLDDWAKAIATSRRTSFQAWLT